jgi:hypothetical protein
LKLSALSLEDDMVFRACSTVVEEDKVDEEVDTIEEKIEGGSSLEQRVGVVTRFEADSSAEEDLRRTKVSTFVTEFCVKQQVVDGVLSEIVPVGKKTLQLSVHTELSGY